MGTVTGINETNVTEWMSEEVNAIAPLTFELIAGGRSNLTFRVTDATGATFALRRPPVSHVLPTARYRAKTPCMMQASFQYPNA